MGKLDFPLQFYFRPLEALFSLFSSSIRLTTFFIQAPLTDVLAWRLMACRRDSSSMLKGFHETKQKKKFSGKIKWNRTKTFGSQFQLKWIFIRRLKKTVTFPLIKLICIRNDDLLSCLGTSIRLSLPLLILISSERNPIGMNEETDDDDVHSVERIDWTRKLVF